MLMTLIMSNQFKQSAASKEAARIKEAASIIAKIGSISRYALQYKLGMNTQQMNVLHPTLEYHLEDQAYYDRPTKTWNKLEVKSDE